MKELTSNFIEKLKELQEKINSFIFASNAAPRSAERYDSQIQSYNELLKNIEQILSKKGSENTQEEDIQDCDIRSMEVIQPIKKFSRFPKFKVKLVLELGSKCDLESKTIQIIYKEGRNEASSPKTIWEKYKEETLPISNVLWDGENKAIIHFLVDFGSTERAKNSATIVVDTFSCKVQYALSNNIKLATKEEAQKTVSTYKWLTTNQYMNEENEDVLNSLCPNLPKKENKSKTKSYFDLDSLMNELKVNPIINEIKEEDYSSLSTTVLEEKKKLYKTNFDILYKIELNQTAAVEVLIDLEVNYTGEEVDKEKVFDDDYKSQIKKSKDLIGLLNNNNSLFTEAIIAIDSELNKRSVPQEVLDRVNQLKQLKTEQLKGLDRWLEKFYVYETQELIFDVVKKDLIEVESYNQEVLNQWDIEFSSCVKYVDAMIANGAINTNNKYYKNWKRDEYIPLAKFKSKINLKQQEILTYVNKYKPIIDRTGGDGILEYVKGENKTSDEEKSKFKEYDGSELYYKDEGKKDLFVDGASSEDIKQGELGDCYLMSALLSLTKGNSNGLLEKMIRDEGNKFVVTLHQNGLPVEVEVDKKILTRRKAVKSTTKGVGDITLYQYDPFLADSEEELWVAIIEKAYAKLLTTSDDKGGDYTKIVGGTASSALEVLLGNKVSSPEFLYLNDEGELTTTKTGVLVGNPIYLSKIDVSTLKKVLISAIQNDYEISLSSPKTFKGVGGLTHDHLLALGKDKYMSFKHAYSIVDATSGYIKAQNPHGDRNTDLRVFDKEVHDIMEELKSVNDEIKSKLEKEKQFSDTLKEKMDELIEKLSLEDVFKKRLSVVIEKWGKLGTKGMIENSDYWKIKKINLYEDWIKTLDRVMKKDIGRGFVFKKISMDAVQEIDYLTLKKYFNLITISIIDLK